MSQISCKPPRTLVSPYPNRRQHDVAQMFPTDRISAAVSIADFQHRAGLQSRDAIHPLLCR
ncbi:hypothetical protein BM221_000912 [Beauveria bassiana]|uniref:Uncharacterized protein n=1 Tax=Beauveria bassiana TaxID=176275 RepID=A0A2N6P1T5_BEABA|nr:hypothetical protein BM221_000912 [Beauveria bassiana]